MKWIEGVTLQVEGVSVGVQTAVSVKDVQQIIKWTEGVMLQVECVSVGV